MKHWDPSHARLKLAIIAARINRDLGTMAEVRDALNARDASRRRRLVIAAARARHNAEQIRIYGRIEVEYQG